MHTVTYSWPTPLSDVVGSVLGAGLHIASLHEHPVCPEQLRPGLVQDTDGLWRSPPGLPALPLVYALEAKKPG